MNKLVKRFKDIINRWDCMVQFPDGYKNCIVPEIYGCIAEDSMEETKKLAIEFAKWLHRTDWYENEELNTSDKLFDKFIDEYYGPTE